MKTLAIILIVDAVLNAILNIIIYKLQKDINKEINKGAEMIRKSIHDEMQKSIHNGDGKLN